MNQFKGGFTLPFPKNNHFENENNCNSLIKNIYDSLFYKLINKISSTKSLITYSLILFSKYNHNSYIFIVIRIWTVFLLYFRSNIFFHLFQEGDCKLWRILIPAVPKKS